MICHYEQDDANAQKDVERWREFRAGGPRRLPGLSLRRFALNRFPQRPGRPSLLLDLKNRRGKRILVQVDFGNSFALGCFRFLVAGKTF